MALMEKNSPVNAGEKRHGLDPWVEIPWLRSPEVGNGNLLQYLIWKIPWTEEPGELQSMGRSHT